MTTPTPTETDQPTQEVPAAEATPTLEAHATTDENASVDHPATPADEEPAEGSHEDKGPHAEAAKWRRKLREAEAERDQYAATVETMRRNEVERIAATLLSQGSDLLDIGGNAVESMLGDDGAVDSTKVLDAARALQLSRPGLSRHGVSATHANFGQGASGPAPIHRSGASWAKVLRG